MKIAIPVEQVSEKESLVSDHFGHAPFFAVADSETNEFNFLDAGKIRQEGECAPLKALAAEGCTHILCRHMGRGALSRCEGVGIAVSVTHKNTVSEAVEEFLHGQCNQVGEGDLCDSSGCDHKQ